MSFILEALKRSENERQRQTGPGLAAAPEGSRDRPRSPWLAVVLALLVLNVGVLAYMLLRPAAAPTAPGAAPAPATAPSATPAPAAAVRAAPTAAKMPETMPASEEPATRPSGEPRRPPATPTSSPPVRGEVRSLRAEVDTPATRAPDPAPATPDEARPRPVRPATGAAPTVAPARKSGEATLPTVAELTLRGEFSGRPLHLDLHVYYDDPARRLVFINGSKYREGERIDDELRVDEIVPDGVVLHDGRQRFLLPST